MQNSGVTPIITLDITPDPLCKYEASSAPGGLVYIASVEPSFKVVHGINMPKVVKMLGSDGVRHTQLVKSNDDLRQDAVIEQLFGLANSLLSESRATRSRSLRIRTYKVVPLTRQTGVLQWVDNTQPIGEYLQSAHARFYPKDLQVQEARRMIATELSRTNSTPESKLAVYNRVTSRLHPVMRFFFLENFPAPDDWYVRRLTYSRSVAVSSVIGHILGIGDRHAQNILIDNRTAEVVHIDLGIAFDNGKLLPTPELVPFRLTRDVVDGMGISGVEGVFRKCCEETLARLRECAQVVVTILDVLKFDPLYQWTLSPTKSRKVRMRGDVDAEDAADALAMLDGLQQQMQMQMQESNREAERALVNIQRKLAADLSVQSQVNDLIVMASSPSILARMYHGWQPYL
ncbi:hypothetical protein GQ42DRAFT_148457 [Ramicandelaber brevisporus]|nr:hypothetical protein GQ42DRAFT_148457 [Ramicandelaber brevisporus]